MYAVHEAPLKEVMTSNGNIIDSGARKEFESGAVRDIKEGKGRCDLIPLDVMARCIDRYYCLTSLHDRKFDIFQFGTSSETKILSLIDSYYNNTSDDCSTNLLIDAICYFCLEERNWDIQTAMLEVSKHFEEGAKKYEENNWKKGIPTYSYIDSAIRHYLKFTRGDTDEPHDRAFIWNLMCCVWTNSVKEKTNEEL